MNTSTRLIILQLFHCPRVNGDGVAHEHMQRNLFVGFEPLPRIPSGIARYTRELSRALEQHAEPEVAVARTHVRERWRPVAARTWVLGLRTGFGATLDAKLDAKLDANAIEHVPASFHATSVLAPRRGASPIVVTIHDTVPFTHPETLTTHGATWHRKMISRAVDGADALVVPTTAVADRLLREFRHAANAEHATGQSLSERIHVAGGAPSLDPVPDDEARELVRASGLATNRPYVVFVGTIEPRKGLEHLVRAVAARNDLNLVVVGPQGWGKVDIRRVAIAARLDPDRLVVTGAVHDSTVASIVQGASLLAMPSLAEGFGLPLIEAMRLGTPVVISNDAALREVAGDAGIVAEILNDDARSCDDVERKLNRAMDEAIDRREDLVVAGHRRAAEFTWEATAARVHSIHRGLMTS